MVPSPTTHVSSVYVQIRPTSDKQFGAENTAPEIVRLCGVREVGGWHSNWCKNTAST
jgi:hypothetical protein